MIAAVVAAVAVGPNCTVVCLFGWLVGVVAVAVVIMLLLITAIVDNSNR